MPRERDAVDGCVRISIDLLGGLYLAYGPEWPIFCPVEQIRPVGKVLLEHSNVRSFKKRPRKLSHSACGASHCHGGHGKYYPCGSSQNKVAEPCCRQRHQQQSEQRSNRIKCLMSFSLNIHGSCSFEKKNSYKTEKLKHGHAPHPWWGGRGGGAEPPAKAWGPQTLPNPVFAMFWGRAHALEKCTTRAQDAADHGTRQ